MEEALELTEERSDRAREKAKIKSNKHHQVTNFLAKSSDDFLERHIVVVSPKNLNYSSVKFERIVPVCPSSSLRF